MLHYHTLLNRKFGVEFEVSNTLSKRKLANILLNYEESRENGRAVITTAGKKGWAETHANDYWHVKYDSTCGPLGKTKDYGWEIASYIAEGTDDIEAISHAASWLHRHKIETNNNCGFHIHVEVKDFDLKEMAALLARWLKIEAFLFLLCEPRRFDNPYCRSLRTKSIYCRYDPCDLLDFWHNIRPDCLETHDNDEKKYTLNTVGYAKSMFHPSYDRKTIELRLPECLLSYDHVKNWIVLMVNFVQCCKNNPIIPADIGDAISVDEFLTLLGLKSNEAFWLLDRDILNTKIWVLERLKIWFPEAEEILDLIINL
jgi:hypothetical protein